LVCRRPAETVSLQRRQICYRWGTPAYWSLVPRSSMIYFFEFCLKNMWICSLTQQILNHSFYDWKLCELFLLSGFLICHAVGWYIEFKNVLMEDTWEKDLDWRLSKIFLEFFKSTCDLCHYASKQFHTIYVVPLLLQTESVSSE
jgi:hypothetical protein